MKKFIVFFLIFSTMELSGQGPWFAIGGQRFQIPQYQIVVAQDATPVELKAASEFQRYLEMITGVKLKIVDETANQSSREIIIGYSGRFPASGISRSLDPDGFEIKIHRPMISIAGGSHKGTLYGVYEFFEKYLRCRFWAPGTESIPRMSEIMLPMGDGVVNPAFRFREVHYAGTDDQDFADKMRLDRHAWKGGENWGMWVHTMFTLVPPEKYFDSHPEYYSLMGGKRAKTQLCLTNPDVLQITIDELKKRMLDNPDAKYWSVSQMDTYGSCECTACTGTLTGSRGEVLPHGQGAVTPSDQMIAFVNKVAAAFPDKVISTLAYQYTRAAPKHVKPAPNVNIMLCTIECDRSRPLEHDTAAGSFVADLKDWSAIADDILVWDYVIQFTNMLAPFPNLPVLQPNIQLFKKYRVSSVFEQGCRGTYSENQELRQYLLAKLLWNPDVNVDSLTNQFLKGYYGAAGPFIGNYLDEMTGALQRSGKTLWIYGSPMQETDAFLSPENTRSYNALFDLAEKAVAGDSALVSRVSKARLPLHYAMLEIAKKNITGPDGFIEFQGSTAIVRKDVMAQLDEFVALAKRYDVTTLHERNLPPDEYARVTSRFFQNAFMDHLAKGKSYTLSNDPSPKYSAEGMGTLTDRKRGTANYYVLWQGFEEKDLTAVIDLGANTMINYASAEFLQDHASWIFYPEKLTVSISTDGRHFTEVAAFDSLSFPDPVVIQETGKTFPLTEARYVRFHARNKGQCPAWHIGHGGKAWLFVDELIVDRRQEPGIR